jgi:hypothetical protein
MMIFGLLEISYRFILTPSLFGSIPTGSDRAGNSNELLIRINNRIPRDGLIG